MLSMMELMGTVELMQLDLSFSSVWKMQKPTMILSLASLLARPRIIVDRQTALQDHTRVISPVSSDE